jgi:hypothetical protein
MLKLQLEHFCELHLGVSQRLHSLDYVVNERLEASSETNYFNVLANDCASHCGPIRKAQLYPI